jgi:formylmethanofuran dehydrogenase subunit C
MTFVVTLTPKQIESISIEAEVIKPENFAGKTPAEIKALPLYIGNRASTIGDIFEVKVEGQGQVEHTCIVINGSVPRVKRIGEKMAAGRIDIKGDVDMHLGAFMSGGSISVNGNADAWAGREMKGGEIVINGDAGNYVGSAYRGEATGMTGGTIIVKGNAGDYCGEKMAGGRIEIHGNAGILAGLSMSGGEIIIKGNATIPGGEMKGGKIRIEGKVLEMLPAFKLEGTEVIDGKEYLKYTGDLSVDGKGTLYVKK